ncbi:hypothetical protein [Vreelandella sp. EE22]
MKKLTTAVAVTFALVSGAAFAERGSAELNEVDQPSSSSEQQIDEGRDASVENLRTKNGSNGAMINHPESSAQSHGTDHNGSRDLTVRNR